MSTWTITSRWAENTTSRDAYYQTFVIEKKGPHSSATVAQVALLHYGPRNSTMLREKRPVLGGQLKLHKGKGDHWVQIKLDEKRERGYIEDTDALESTDYDVHSEGIFRTTLTVWFGAFKRDEILLALGMTVGNNADDAPSDDLDDSFMPAVTAHTTSHEDDPRWGAF